SIVLLIGTAAVFTVYLWKVLPLMVHVSQSLNLALDLPVRISVRVSQACRWILPVLVPGLVTLYLVRRRTALPESIRSGMALAIVAGAVLMLSLVGLLV